MAMENMFSEQMKQQVAAYQAAKSEADRNAALQSLAEQVANLSNKESKTEVTNLDEIKAALRNELNRSLKPIRESVPKSMKGIEKELQDVGNLSLMKTVENLPNFLTAMLVKFLDFQTNNREKDRVNLEKLIEEVIGTIVPAIQESIQLEVSPTPVEVKPADVNINLNEVVGAIKAIPAPQSLNLEPLLRALTPLQILSGSPKSPLSVRMSDGIKFLKFAEELKEVLKSIDFKQGEMKAIIGGGTTIAGVARTRETGHATFGDGRKVVTTAGTAVQLSTTSVACNKVIITAEEDNVGDIVVGGSTVVAASATRRGIPLVPSQGTIIEVDNLNKIYIDSEQNGEGVTYAYMA